jgi:hypothetical protein
MWPVRVLQLKPALPSLRRTADSVGACRRKRVRTAIFLDLDNRR